MLNSQMVLMLIQLCSLSKVPTVHEAKNRSCPRWGQYYTESTLKPVSVSVSLWQGLGCLTRYHGRNTYQVDENCNERNRQCDAIWLQGPTTKKLKKDKSNLLGSEIYFSGRQASNYDVVSKLIVLYPVKQLHKQPRHFRTCTCISRWFQESSWNTTLEVDSRTVSEMGTFSSPFLTDFLLNLLSAINVPK